MKFPLAAGLLAAMALPAMADTTVGLLTTYATDSI